MTQLTFSPGTVVQNRNRLWRVDGYASRGDVLLVTAIDGDAIQQKFYLPFEKVQLSRLPAPSTQVVGYPASQDLLLRAFRLSMLHGSAPLLSLQRSRVIPKDYQLVPVVMSMEMARVRMLLADDVGLGKTIEAGLIITELMARQRAGRVLFIVPAGLREQWQEALDYFFHIPARIISTRHRREMERQLPVGANPWEYYRVLITSVDYAKQPAIKNQILEHSWDAVVIDEAHLVAKPHQSTKQRVSMERWQLAEALASSERVRHLLLLTATPHNGYTDSFASLLRLLDVGAVRGESHEPVIMRQVALRHVCQRRRQDVEKWFEGASDRNPFPQRDQSEVIVVPSSFEKAAIDAVEAYGEEVLSHAERAGKQAHRLATWTVLHLHKRALSSPEALRCSLRNRRASLQARLANQLAFEDISAILPEEVARATVLDEDTGERFDDEEAALRTDRAVFSSVEAIRTELAALEKVIQKAERVTPRRDSKLRELLKSTLYRRLATSPKVVIFTRYLDTLSYLAREIGHDKSYSKTKIVTIYGGLNERQRRDKFQAFESAKQAVLIATDAISEGINLQHAASQVIHYELPWNPNRLEQRNGRVDRFGQPKPVVYVRTMVMDETLEASILHVLVKKAARIRQDFGFSPPYFGEETDVIELIRDHHQAVGAKQLSLFDSWELPSEPVNDPLTDETATRIRDESFYGQTHITLPEIEQRLTETAATIGSPEQIRAFVFSALNRFGCSVRDNRDGTWRLTISQPRLQTASVGKVMARATFDAQRGLDQPDVTVLDLGHPLVRRLIEQVKQSAFRETGDYGRTSYMVTADTEEVTALFHLLVRYPIHSEPVSIIEELIPVAMTVYGEEVLSQDATRQLLQAIPSAQQRTDDEVQETLVDAFEIEELDETLAHAVETQRQALIAERRTMRQQLEAENKEGQLAWLRGIDSIAPGNYDILTVTIYYPA